VVEEVFAPMCTSVFLPEVEGLQLEQVEADASGITFAVKTAHTRGSTLSSMPDKELMSSTKSVLASAWTRYAQNQATKPGKVPRRRTKRTKRVLRIHLFSFGTVSLLAI
jgi:hypothetical protein